MKKRSSSKKRRGGAMEHQALTGSRQRKKTIPEAEAVAESARKLLGAADKTHREADELHQAIHQMHGAVEGMHAGGTRPSLAETRDLVTGQSIRSRPLPFPIVGIGASAGGYEAFTEFVEHLPQDSGMAFVLVQHLDPKHKRKLTELLAHCSRIPVEEVQSDAQVRPNRIYVIPENTTMTILGGRLRLAPRNDFATAAMPIDLFFRSLAQHQQSNAIA